MVALWRSIQQISREPIAQFGLFFISLYALFVALALVYFPRNLSVVLRHGGVFFADRVVVSILFGALLVAYIILFRRVRRWVTNRHQFMIMLGVAFISMCLLIMAPPFFSSDLFGNGTRAIIATTHEVNPYTVPPNDLGYQAYVAWGDKGAPYGPLFTGFTLLLARVSGNNIMLFVTLFRIVAIGIVLLISWLLYDSLRRLNPRFAFAGTTLFLWNPFVLFELVQSAHNEIFVVLLIVLAVWLCIRKQFVWALIALTAGYLVKFIPAVLIPIVGLLLVLHAQTWRRAIRDILLAAVGCIGLVALAYAPFGGALANVSNAIGGFIQYDNLTFPQAIITMAVTGVSTIFPGLSPSLVTMRVAYLLVFIIFSIIVVARSGLREPDQFIQRMLWVLFAFVFLLGAKLNIWYVLWFMPLLLLVRNVWYHYVIILVTLLGFLYYSTLNVFFPTVFFFILLIGWFAVWRWWRPRPA